MSPLYPFERAYLNARLEKKMRKNLRRLKKKEREFCLALKHVMLKVPGPESDTSKKVISALKIGRSTYYERLEKAEFELAVRAMGEEPQRKDTNYEYENN